jgi:hypothetical protein
MADAVTDGVASLTSGFQMPNFGASFNSAMSNPMTWIVVAFTFIALTVLLIIFIIVIAKKTHMVVEMKAWMKGYPISQFYQENRYVEWKAIKPSCGVIEDKNYGTFIINDRATYIDKTTKNVMLPFDAQFAAGVNMHAAKLADDLQYIMKDDEQMKLFRTAIAKNMLDETLNIDAIKTTVNIGAIKSMMSALIPHNINAKIQYTIASKMKNYGKVDGMQILLIFAGILGAILMGYLIIKSVAPGST